jgi:hypothetical protein
VIPKPRKPDEQNCDHGAIGRPLLVLAAAG